MRGANLKHAVHAHDPGRVEAQRLVERRRALQSRKGSIGRGATYGVGGCRGSGGGASSVQERPRLWGLRVGRCGAHVEHGLHSRDAGRVEAQRLVERRRALPRKKKKHSQRGGVRAGRVSGRRKRRKQSRKAPTVEAEARTRKERTENMPFMLMTLDVSKLSGWLNADAPCQVEKEA